MNKELVVNVQNDQITIALLEDKNLVELHKDTLQPSYAVGNIYLGRVKKVMQGLNAAFVDIGLKNDGLIHISQMSDKRIAHPLEVLSINQHLSHIRVLEVDKEKGKVSLSLKSL